MIIECPACSKKFNIDEKLIPDEGRLLKCGNCVHTWFFKKEENLKLETETLKINEIEENKSEINVEPVEKPIKQTKKIRKKTYFPFFFFLLTGQPILPRFSRERKFRKIRKIKKITFGRPKIILFSFYAP